MGPRLWTRRGPGVDERPGVGVGVGKGREHRPRWPSSTGPVASAGAAHTDVSVAPAAASTS